MEKPAEKKSSEGIGDGDCHLALLKKVIMPIRCTWSDVGASHLYIVSSDMLRLPYRQTYMNRSCIVLLRQYPHAPKIATPPHPFLYVACPSSATNSSAAQLSPI